MKKRRQATKHGARRGYELHECLLDGVWSWHGSSACLLSKGVKTTGLMNVSDNSNDVSPWHISLYGHSSLSAPYTVYSTDYWQIDMSVLVRAVIGGGMSCSKLVTFTTQNTLALRCLTGKKNSPTIPWRVKTIGCSSPSVCLSVCPDHNSKTNDPKVFKLGIGNDLGISDKN